MDRDGVRRMHRVAGAGGSPSGADRGVGGSGTSLLADTDAADAGQGVGAVTAVRTAVDVVDELRAGAIALLRASAPSGEVTTE